MRSPGQEQWRGRSRGKAFGISGFFVVGVVVGLFFVFVPSVFIFSYAFFKKDPRGLSCLTVRVWWEWVSFFFLAEFASSSLVYTPKIVLFYRIEDLEENP